MSPSPHAAAGGAPHVGPAPSARSLAARLRRRGEQLSHELTTIVPIPGWDDILSVELRALPYQTIRGIQKRNVRMPDEAGREGVKNTTTPRRGGARGGPRVSSARAAHT